MSAFHTAEFEHQESSRVSRQPSGQQAGVQEMRIVHRLFEEQALTSAGRVAAVFEKQEITYEALNQRANRLAHALVQLGAGPEMLIGLCMDRSLEMLVGILGILKAGAAYLPLDPAYPRERLAFMLSDAQVKLLLTQEKHLPQLPQSGARILCLDRDYQEIERQSAENPVHRMFPDNPAYVIYTSGSTGTPKGVVVTHANVVRLFEKTKHWFNFTRQDVWTLFHSSAFDFSVWEIWGALLHGGKLLIVPYFVSRTPEAFYRLLADERVTILNQTPSAFRQLIRVEGRLAQNTALALRLVIFGGEALKLTSLQPWIERHGDDPPQLINMFGITETTVHVTFRRILHQDVETGPGSVIGCAIPDLQVYACDESLNPLAAGQAGELYIAGEGVARGYLRRPELTAERFIPNPFSRELGGRLYRSGDLARVLSGNDLEYLGRIDQQVKVRGFRIELGEIEGLLARYPGVRECAVAAQEDQDGEKRLVAYITGQSPCPSEELHNYLRHKLPDYMLPAAIVPLQELPLTAHGKLDRSGLPKLDLQAISPEGIYAAAGTATEKTLAEVWAESLGLSRVGMDDNYFALGGDSIRSIKVRAKALERGLRFSLQQLFQNPTVRGLAAEIDPRENAGQGDDRFRAFSMISEEDRRKLPPDAEDAYPLSQVQSGLIFHSEYSPDYIIYVSSFHLCLDFHAQKMQQTLDSMARRHEMLRTSFDLKNFNTPLQIVHRQAHPELVVNDLRHLALEEQQQRIDAWLDHETRRRFDWTRAPLLRFHAHLRSNGTIQFTMSEPFLDGWSVASLVTELFECYLALLRGENVPDARLASSYRDYVALEQLALQSEPQHRYWAEILAAGAAAHLPLRKLAGSTAGQQVVRLQVPVSEETTQGLKDVARRCGVSLKSVLLAAHMKVVSTLSGHSEALTGLLTNGRPEKKDGDKLIGGFLNIVPFRMQLGRRTWIDLARVAQATENQALPFRRYPFPELQRLHEAEKKFDTLFNYTHFHVLDRLSAVPGITVLEMKGSEQTYFALTAQFSINEFSSGVDLALDYRTLELEDEQVKEIAGYYVRVLQAMAANPSQHHDSVCLLSSQEFLHLVTEFNHTQAPFSQSLCLHQMFVLQAAKLPQHAAVVFGENRLTYCALEDRSNQLARYLQQLRVGPDTLVGICLESGLEAIVALLAILKAGGAYVPLDPEYPDERRTFMCSDARVKVVVTQERLRNRIPATEIRCVCLDSERPAIERENAAPLPLSAQPGNLAYVIYTSGSTGIPKGVLIEHRGVVNIIEDTIRKFGVGENKRVAQFTSLNFDPSVLEIFTALLSGATLYPVPREVLMSPEEIGRFLLQNAITATTIPPSVLDLIPVGEYPGLRAIAAGGEACGAETAARWSRGRRLLHVYGPTETTIFATNTFCRDGERQAPPLGRPIPNMQVYLLDQAYQPVATGVSGEIYIGGVGVGRGYLRRPDLTAETFIPNPFSGEPGTRLYKTGDLARFLPDGNLQFLGRIGQQVKVRGFRIELGEIEAALGTHPQVREAAVVVREDQAKQKQIIAYIVPNQSSVPTTTDLYNHLKSRLPDYMLPAAFVMLEAMPLSQAGKLNRDALPAPRQLRPDLAQSYVAPRTTLEKVLAGIFSEMLKIEQIGVLDDFFELGGHSLLATQVVSRIRQHLSIELPLRILFEEPTVKGLATAILSRQEDPVQARTERITRRQDTDSAPLSFAQQRLWFLQQLDPASHLYNITAALRIQGVLNIPALEQAVNEIIRRHESLRTVFKVVASRPLQFVNPPFALRLLPITVRNDDAATAEREIAEQAVAEARHVPDLSAGPLFRAKLLRRSESEHVLLLCMHHIVSDGWSMGVFLRELGAFYESVCKARELQLLELPIQYSDFAVWQRSEELSARRTDQLAYWKDQLAGVPPVLELPTDYPRSTHGSFRGSATEFSIPKDLADRLGRTGQAEGTTLFMTLLGAFSILLYRYSGQEDFTVGTPIAGRNRPEIEDLIGFFVNMLVLRVRISSDLTFRDLLRRSKEVCLGAYAHQDVPFETLVKELHPERDLGHSPLFQVVLDLQNAPTAPMDFSDLRLALLPVATETAKFDLTMTLSEAEAGIEGALEYSTELFADSTMARMLKNFRILLEDVAANPEQPVFALALLSEAEKTTLLAYPQSSGSHPQSWLFVHQRFQQQARETPNQTAVVCHGEPLTYGELNRRSNQLAHYLISRGFGPEMLAGICMERSATVVVAVLAVLKSGAAYLPLDPAYPRERLAFMMDTSKLHLVITQARFLQQLPQPAARMICLDAEIDRIAARPFTEPVVQLESGNPAYVIYTSGSTGRPKAAVISHAGLNHSTQSRIAYYKEQIQAFLLLPSFSFDSSVAGLFWTLCGGGKLVIPPEGSHHDAEYLAGLMQQHSVSHLLCLPTLYRLLLEQQSMQLASLRVVIVAGEAAPGDLFPMHHEHLPQCRLFNEYGPTEAAVWSTVFECISDTVGNSIPIGRPIANTRIYLLDDWLQLVPIGVAGEVYISSQGLARGYLDSPELTADRFLPDPFYGHPGSRLYRTGDLARYRADGDLQFLGRDDLQVKIRGYRIELAEVESALSRHPSVRQAAVVAGDNSLTAYVAPMQSHGASAHDLRKHLSSILPAYMLPAAFVFLESLPSTVTGKVDRKALKPRAGGIESARAYVAPRTAVEQVLAEIFAAMLGRERLGIHDDFFEIGGHSLVATQLVSRIREALHVDLPLRRIFEQPTIAGLAGSILSDSPQAERVERMAELLVHFAALTEEQAAALAQQATEQLS